MSELNTQGEPRMGGGGGSFDELTPYERLWADNVDLCARLRLAEERAFEQAAEIARLKSSRECVLRALRMAKTWLDAFKRREGLSDDGPLAHSMGEIDRVLKFERD